MTPVDSSLETIMAKTPRLLIPFLLLFALSPFTAHGQDGPKVFISVDMEGITGVANWEETGRAGKDYDYFRRLMALEANAAVLGAFDAGATEVVVRDSHGSARNILPELLDPRAYLIRDWSGGPKSMMEGIDESFDAAVFIGYHAKAGTADALLEHTTSLNVQDFTINGRSYPEAGYNSLIAGVYGVPVVFVAGDKAICDQVQGFLTGVATFATKEGIGGAAKNLHPEVSREGIRAGVAEAVRNRGDYRPYQLSSPYTLVLRLKSEESTYNGSFFPGAERTGDWELTITSEKFLDLLYAYSIMRR
jgi:D-amino peptidase